MRIHSDTLTDADLYRAAEEARVTLVDMTRKGSRQRDHAFNVVLRGESNRAPNFGNGSPMGHGKRAATWDQWGVFLAALFDLDPDMLTPYYRNAEDFHYQTSHRFAGGWPTDAHGDHTFEWIAPRVFGCTKCSAVKRGPE